NARRRDSAWSTPSTASATRNSNDSSTCPSQPDPGETTMTRQAFICDAIRTPFGRYGGALSSVRTDDLGVIPIKALMARNAKVDWASVTDVLYGCVNQAGEDNRNVARMVSLLAGLPMEVP